MEWMDIKDRLMDESVLAVLAHSQYMPSAERMHALAERLRADSSMNVWGIVSASSVFGVLVFRRTNNAQIEITSIAVHEERRREGFGHRMIGEIRSKYPLCVIFAETDDEAVGFYKACGFAIRPAKDKGGIRRWTCTLPSKEE